jgi:cell division protein FtsN
LQQQQQQRDADAADAAQPAVAPPATVAATAAATDGAHYILQAGSFGASGDAEALKARIALLGLSARVESAAINGKTMYRVRMGPYSTASDLAAAKQKLGNGGLPALAIKAK